MAGSHSSDQQDALPARRRIELVLRDVVRDVRLRQRRPRPLRRESERQRPGGLPRERQPGHVHARAVAQGRDLPEAGRVRTTAIVRVWVNGVLAIDRSDVDTRSTPIDNVTISGIWGGVGDSKNQADYMRFDRIRISRPLIGSTGSSRRSVSTLQLAVTTGWQHCLQSHTVVARFWCSPSGRPPAVRRRDIRSTVTPRWPNEPAGLRRSADQPWTR